MKHAYETFTDMAKDFTSGENWTHQLSDHTSDDCSGWQHGILEFARWLDECGVKIIQNPEIYDKLWENVRTHKPGWVVAVGRCAEHQP